MVVDTNIFIKHLRAANKSNTLLSNLSKQGQIFITSITLFELLIGATNDKKKEDVHKLTNGIPILTLDEESSKIAAICLKNGHTIQTLNKKHFERINGLLIDKN